MTCITAPVTIRKPDPPVKLDSMQEIFTAAVIIVIQQFISAGTTTEWKRISAGVTMNKISSETSNTNNRF
jgi:hypothetical protein